MEHMVLTSAAERRRKAPPTTEQAGQATIRSEQIPALSNILCTAAPPVHFLRCASRATLGRRSLKRRATRRCTPALPAARRSSHTGAATTTLAAPPMHDTTSAFDAGPSIGPASPQVAELQGCRHRHTLASCERGALMADTRPNRKQRKQQTLTAGNQHDTPCDDKGPSATAPRMDAGGREVESHPWHGTLLVFVCVCEGATIVLMGWYVWYCRYRWPSLHNGHANPPRKATPLQG